MTWWRTLRRVWGCARTVRGVPQTKSPRGCLFLRESKKERKREHLGRVGEEKGSLLRFHPAAWDPPARGTRGQSAEPTRTVREVRGRSGTQARTVRYLFQDIQYCPSPHRAARTVRVALADGPPGADGQSDPPPQIVRPPLFFQLDKF
jgi:hypothetical protein